MRNAAIVMAALCLAATVQTAAAQTLEEVAVFVLTGGDELEMIPPDTDGFRRWSSQAYLRAQASAFNRLFEPLRVKVDAASCGVRVEGKVGSKEPVDGVQEFYLNNVILSEMRELDAWRSPGKILVFTGEISVMCSNFDNKTSDHTACDEKSKSFQIYVAPEKRQRFEKAIAYLYSKYCKAAVRKSAY
jgi:hypothetical protein